MTKLLCSLCNNDSFEEAVQFALERLHMKDLHPREEQLQSIKAVYDGLNVFVCLPTGFGKSLCYQAIPFVMDFKLGRVGTSITSAILVVSPLVSLMVDQVEDLRRRKVKTSLITSGSDLAKRSAEPTNFCVALRSHTHSTNTFSWALCLVIIFMTHRKWRSLQ